MDSGPISRRHFLFSGMAALAAAGQGGCLPPNTAAAPRGPRLQARPSVPVETVQGGRVRLHPGQERGAHLFVPSGRSPDAHLPLVVALHGASGNAAMWDPYHEVCESRGVILLAIDSRGATWDRVGGVFGPDVAFIDEALGWTFDRCDVEAGHIALLGFSDGASYALSLGLANGDLFTHLVAFSPGFLAPVDSVIGDPRIFVSHGEHDPVLPVALSRNRIIPRLRVAGYDVTYEEFDGGHNVPREITDRAFDWFLV